MLDAQDNCIYVGKAKNLKNRVSSYFTNIDGHTRKTQRMLQSVEKFETTVTTNENEALILESNLIKSLRPRYNILLRDDKSYPFIYLDDRHEFPRLKFHRGVRRHEGKFFGPFPNVTAVRETLVMIERLFRVRQCEESFFKNRSRACLQHQIGRCSAPCVGLINKLDYQQDVSSAVMLLEGKNKEVAASLNKLMEQASQELNYELAAKLRDQLKYLNGLQLDQAVDSGFNNTDIVAIANKQGVACIQVFFVRHGRMLGNKSYFPTNTSQFSKAEILDSFLKQYYLTEHTERIIPREIIVDEKFDELKILQSAIESLYRRKLKIKTSVRGLRADWLRMAVQNADIALQQRLSSVSTHNTRFVEFRKMLKLKADISRIECFDISHLAGEATVGSCVVYDQNGPLKTDYRKFNIKDAKAGDDYAAMSEVLSRRYVRALREERKLPDLLVVDGGKGQVSQAVTILNKLGLDAIKILGVSKGPSRKPGLEKLISYEDGEFRTITSNPKGLYLLQNIRDEAHRFAIEAHRKSRIKKRNKSKLDYIEGVGNKRRKSLVRYFGGISGIERAGISDLQKVPGISRALAVRIHDGIRS